MTANLHKFKQDQQTFSDHIRKADSVDIIPGVEARRMKIYRELFFNNIEGFISSTFPVLNELLTSDQWERLVRDFFVTHSCQSPYFLKISEEFLEYIEQSTLDFLPEFAYQLAHWEWMELYADVVETSDVSEVLEQIELTDCITTNDCTWNVAYDFCVQKISSDYIPDDVETTFLIVHRDTDLSVGFIEINPLSMMLFEQLKSNQNKTLDELLAEISTQQKIDPETVKNGGLDIIRQWGYLGLLKII